MYKLVFTNKGEKDLEKLLKSEHKERGIKLLDVLSKDPFQVPPPLEMLTGEWAGHYSRLINVQHRIVYKVYDNVVEIAYCWTHYHKG